MNPHLVVSALIFHQQSLLSLQRSADAKVFPSCWEVVSGRVRNGEDLRDAVMREIWEETRQTVTVSKDAFDVYEAPRGEDQMIVHVFFGTTTTTKVTLSDEHQAYQWLSLDAFSKQCFFPRLVESAYRSQRLLPTTE